MIENRKIIQLLSTAAGNAHVKGLLTGRIYQGKLKSVCFPGLNCYSCPAAVGACPLGSLQSMMGASPVLIPLYITGYLMLAGLLLGRVICGFLCPFGLFQELLHSIPTKKLKINRKYIFVKYIILFALVLFLPIYTFVAKGYAVPTFCKYLCPAGTIFAGFPLLLWQKPLLKAAGLVFLIKLTGALITIAASAVTYRPFCRVLCPLGAIYGFFNKYSIIKMEHNNNKCTGCGICRNVCKMGVEPDANINSMECIRCGDCVKACKPGAICFTSHIKRRKQIQI